MQQLAQTESPTAVLPKGSQQQVSASTAKFSPILRLQTRTRSNRLSSKRRARLKTKRSRRRKRRKDQHLKFDVERCALTIQRCVDHGSSAGTTPRRSAARDRICD